jgi:Photosynthetic reaction centre cytochrome C subunit
MHVIESSLGVDCEYCHDAKDRSKDDLEPKRTARKMIAMVFDINKNTFNGEQVVTCYTCHRGSPKPIGSIVLPIPNPMVEKPKPLPPNLPAVDQILSTYVQAIGGAQAIRKVTSRVITATRDIPTGPGG